METEDPITRLVTMPRNAILPEHAEYDTARISFNGMLDRHPAAIISCSSTNEVVEAVRYARQAGRSIAIRGGGHSVAGHSMVDGAVVVSLDRMRNVEVDPEARLAESVAGLSGMTSTRRPMRTDTPFPVAPSATRASQG